MDPRSFLENYQVTDIEKDPLPIKVLRNAITKEEIPGQAVHWGFDYLDQRSCPLTLINHILEKLYQEVHQTDFSHCREAADDSLDGSGSIEHEMRFEPLKLMRAIVKKLDEICVKEKEDYHDSVDGVVESPDMLPHVFAVSYNNIKNSRRFMEDRMTVLPRMDRLFKLNTPISYFAVFDGHNGSEAAAYGAAQLHQYLIQSMNQHQDIIPSISDAFESLDDNFIEKCRNGKIKSGSTVVLSLIMPGKLYVAWLGDSQAVLVKANEVNNLVTPHKPERNDEIDRIRSLGGEVIQMHDTYRVNGNLAVSRAIGDADQKTFIISTPDIKMLELDGSEEFLILACDGLWDEISPEAAAQIVRRQVLSDPTKVSAISQKLVQQAKLKGSQDNISVIVVFLEPLESIRNRYEGVLEPDVDVDVTIWKQSPEPIGVVPMEKFIEHGVDSTMPLMMEMNGHSKVDEQQVDFLSFGSSKESGAQIIGDDTGNHSDEDAVKKEVEEELSDAESDDEWQFEKPSDQGVSLTTIPTGNGLSENPFETAVLDDIAMVPSESHIDQPATVETVMLEKEQPSENPVESFNPFSTVVDTTHGAEHVEILEPFTGYQERPEDQFAPITDQHVDLSQDINMDTGISTVNLDLDSVPVFNTDSSDSLIDAPSMANQDYASNLESAEKPFVEEVMDDVTIMPENLTSDLDNTIVNVDLSNPFGVASVPVDSRPESSGIIDFNDELTQPNENGVAVEENLNGNPFEMPATTLNVTFSDDLTQQFQSVNAMSQGILAEFYEESNKEPAQVVDDTFNNFGGDEFLAQVESNPIPEEMMEEVEKSQQSEEVKNEMNINPFSEPHDMMSATIIAEAMSEPYIDQPESSVDVQDDDEMPVAFEAPCVKFEHFSNEQEVSTSDHTEKFEQEPLVDAGDWPLPAENITEQIVAPIGGDEHGFAIDEPPALTAAMFTEQIVCLDDDPLKDSVSPTADRLEVLDAVANDIPVCLDVPMNDPVCLDDQPIPTPVVADEQPERREDLSIDQPAPIPLTEEQQVILDVVINDPLERQDVIVEDMLVRPDSLSTDERLDCLCDYQSEGRSDSVQSKESVHILLAPKFQDTMESPIEHQELLSESPNPVITEVVLDQVSSPVVEDLIVEKKEEQIESLFAPRSPSVGEMIAGGKSATDVETDMPNDLSSNFQKDILSSEPAKLDEITPAANGAMEAIEDERKTPANSGAFDNNWNVVPSHVDSSTTAESEKMQTIISTQNEETKSNAVEEQCTLSEVNLNESAPVEPAVMNGVAEDKSIPVVEKLSKSLDLPIAVPSMIETTGKNKVEGKPSTKPVKTPTKPEVTMSKAKVTANTAASPKKSPAKPESPTTKASGLVNGKPTATASKPALKSAVGTAPKTTASKTAAVPKATGIAKSGPLPTARIAPVKSVNGVDAKPATTTKSTTAPAPRTRLAPAPSTTKPSAPKTNTLSSTASTTSPKRTPAVGGIATTKPAMAKPPTTSAVPKVGDSAAKSGLASARARPKPLTTATTTVKAPVGTDVRKPTLSKPSTSSAKPSNVTAPKPPAARSGPMSARTALPTKSAAATTKPTATRTAPKPVSDSKPAGTLSARTASRAPAAAATTKAPVAAKKAESTVLKPKKPLPTALGKGDSATKPIKTSINKKVATASNEKAELIQQNGLTSNGENETKALNAVNGGTNGDLNGVNGETEKQDAIKENGVHHDEDHVGADLANSAAPIEPIQNLLG